MTQDELDAVFDVAPQGLAISMGVYYKIFCAAEEISKEVSKNIDGCFVAWQWTETHAIHLQFHGLGAQSKLETGGRVESKLTGHRAHSNRDIQFCFDPLLVFSTADYGSIICFGASSHDFAMFVIIHDGGNLGISGYMFLAGVSA